MCMGCVCMYICIQIILHTLHTSNPLIYWWESSESTIVSKAKEIVGNLKLTVAEIFECLYFGSIPGVSSALNLSQFLGILFWNLIKFKFLYTFYYIEVKII